jgi:hypothetical protein
MSVVVDGKPADRAWNIPPLVRGAGGELPEGFALGEWTVTHLRGTEASCEVYLVTHAVDGSSCVARVARRSALAARPGLAGAMLAGAKQLAKLRHPNLLAVCGHGWTDETSPRPYVLHERVVGRDLAAYQARHGAVEPGLLLAIACQCAAALAAMHAAGLAHADLWRGCAVLVPVGGGAGQIKLGGLELAQRIRAGATADEEPLVAADLAALGAMLGELAEDVPGVPAALAEVIARLTDPQRMPRSAGEVLAAIQGADPGASVIAEPAQPLRMAGASGLWMAREFGQVSLVLPRERPARSGRSAAWPAVIGAVIVGAIAVLVMMLAGRSLAPELRRIEVGGEAPASEWKVPWVVPARSEDAGGRAVVRAGEDGEEAEVRGASAGEDAVVRGAGAGEGEDAGVCASAGAGEAEVRGAGEDAGVRASAAVRGDAVGVAGATTRDGSSGPRRKVAPVPVVLPPVEAVPVEEAAVEAAPVPPPPVEEADDGLLPVVRGKAEFAGAGPFLKTTDGA